MSVHLADGTYEVPTGISQRRATHWAELAKQLGLSMLTEIRFNGWPLIDADNVEPLIAEFERLRMHFLSIEPADREPNGWYDSDAAKALISHLARLRGHTGWEADLG